MSELYNIMSKIIYDREEMQKSNNYILKRKDKKDGFSLEIFRDEKNILNVEYGKSGGVVTNISASKEEIDDVICELNSCLEKKSYLK